MQSLQIAVLTLSDTRTFANDTSGDFLQQAAEASGHKVVARTLHEDCRYKMQATVSAWIASDDVQVVLVTGGTGFAGRDSTPESLSPLFDKQIEGFGEIFRYESYKEIGSSTIQSRAVAGMANGVVIFCMPGSTGACKTAYKIIEEQLNSEHKPCNFAKVLKKVGND